LKNAFLLVEQARETEIDHDSASAVKTEKYRQCFTASLKTVLKSSFTKSTTGEERRPLIKVVVLSPLKEKQVRAIELAQILLLDFQQKTQ
jgi:hypothetical protein